MNLVSEVVNLAEDIIRSTHVHIRSPALTSKAKRPARPARRFSVLVCRVWVWHPHRRTLEDMCAVLLPRAVRAFVAAVRRSVPATVLDRGAVLRKCANQFSV
jgi:hypothetical protein